MSNDETPNMNSTPEEVIDEMISGFGLTLFSVEVREEVEAFLASGQALEPATRAGLIDAAKRGVRHVVITQAPLEVVLFNARRDRQLDAEEVARSVNMSADAVRGIERGERVVRDEPADTLAAWARRVGVERSLLSAALRKSLSATASSASYAGEREGPLSHNQESFVESVLAEFDKLSGKVSE